MPRDGYCDCGHRLAPLVGQRGRWYCGGCGAVQTLASTPPRTPERPTREARALSGALAQEAGASWESVIEDYLRHAAAAGACTWWRTPERLRRVRDLGSGHFECVAIGEGPPDYVVLARGVALACEAKSTSSLRWPFRALPEHQARALDDWEEHGGIGVLLLSVGGVRRAVPWRLVSGRWHGWDEGARSLSSDEVDALGFEMDLRGEWIGRFRDHSHP